MRADPRHRHARMLIVSGHADPAFAEAARAAGADAVLVKPVAAHTLLNAIADALRAAA